MSNEQSDPVQALFAEGMAHLEAGRVDAARQRLTRLLRLRPDTPEAHYHLARIAVDGLDPATALSHAREAVRLLPQEPATWVICADCVALSADAVEMESYLAQLRLAAIPEEIRAAILQRFADPDAAAPSDPEARELRQVQLLLQAGRFDQAEAAARKLLRTRPEDARLMMAQATAETRLGRPAVALDTLRRAAAAAPEDARVQSELGGALIGAGALEEAVGVLCRAVVLGPRLWLANKLLAEAFNARDDGARALRYAEAAARLRPDDAAVQTTLYTALTAVQDIRRAEAAIRRATELLPNVAECHALHGQALSRLERDEEALEAFDRALAINPRMAMALNRRAVLLQTLGRFDEAGVSFRAAMAEQPRNGENYRAFVVGRKVAAGDPILDEMIALFEDPATSTLDRSSFAFAIAKVLEDQKQYDRVFPYLRAANDLSREIYPYDIGERRGIVRQVKAAMEGYDWSAPPLEGTTDFAPVFVTGMPRSGTTLVEQIIASHSSVTGVGEVNIATLWASRTLADPERDHLRMTEVPEERLVELGHRYEEAIRHLVPEADRVTDKSIETYLHLGLLARALPKARFVVVRRDPRDNLLSIYKNKLQDGPLSYSNNLLDLARYYRIFDELIAFWRALLPGRFYEVRYEDLVSDPEVQSRALIAACGLDWEDACLDFHKTERKVKTLSVFQVRQPISRASMKSWQRYEDHLGPMFAALGDLLPQDETESTDAAC